MRKESELSPVGVVYQAGTFSWTIPSVISVVAGSKLTLRILLVSPTIVESLSSVTLVKVAVVKSVVTVLVELAVVPQPMK